MKTTTRLFKGILLVLGFLIFSTAGFSQSATVDLNDKQAFMQEMTDLPDNMQKVISDNFENFNDTQKKNLLVIARKAKTAKEKGNTLPYNSVESKKEWLKNNPIQGISGQ